MKKSATNAVEKSFLKFVGSMKSFNDEKMTISGVIGSDDSLDRHGDRINPKGWKIDNYKKNPVILLNHQYHELPIAKAVGVKRSGNGLVFEIQFSKSYDKSVTAYNLAKEGILNAWSVGFIILKWGEAGNEYTIDEAELLELSLVTVPANPNALTPAQKEMISQLDINTKDVAEKPENDTNDTPDQTGETAKTDETTQEEVVETNEEGTTDETTPTETVTEEKGIQEKGLLDFKSLEKDEGFLSFINSIIEEQVKKYLESIQVQPDEEKSEDLTLLALNAMRQELQQQNKSSGKTLQAFNVLISNMKKE